MTFCFVVDTNILFSFFWKDSVFNEILSQKIKLFSPVLSLDEIKKYSKEISKKSKLSKKQFNSKLEILKTKVIFIDYNEYYSQIKKPSKQLDLTDFSEEEKIQIYDDIDFIALSYLLDYPIWSNDKLLKKQKLVPVFSTEEIINLISK